VDSQGVTVNLHHQMGAEQMAAYLQEGQRVAVLASPADSSGFALLELLLSDVNLLAIDSGGAQEIVHKDNHASNLVNVPYNITNVP
jgi:hypothetical protein